MRREKVQEKTRGGQRVKLEEKTWRVKLEITREKWREKTKEK